MSFMDVVTTGPFARLQSLSDATLRTTDGSVFPVHKIILARHSDYFQALFCGNFSPGKEILIQGIDGRTLNDILIYIYTGRIKFDVENILNMLVASDYLLDNKLMEECKLFALRTMSISSSLPLLSIAFKYERLGILSDCYRFVQVHFDDILYSPKTDIGDVPLEVLYQLLGDKSLNVAEERDVWMAIVMWIEKNILDRMLYVPSLVSCLSLEAVDESLAKDIILHPFVQNNRFCEAITKSTGTYFSKLECFLSRIQSPVYNISRYPDYLNLIVHFYSSDYNENIEIFLTYDSKLDMWRQLCTASMTSNLVVLARQYVYMFNTYENQCTAFNITEKFWFTPDSHNMPRFKYCVVEVEGSIYILGGFLPSVNEATNFVEVYNLDTNTWDEVSRMSFMNTYDAVSLDGKIYAFGDTFNGHEIIMVAQAYNPHLDRWTFVTSPRISRRDFIAVAYKRHIYLIGGHEDGTSLTNVEQYDPFADVWMDFPDLPFFYFVPSAVVLQDTLIVYDGHTMDRERYKTNASCYWDEYESCWKTFVSDLSLDNIHLFRFCEIHNAEIVRDLTRENRRPELLLKNSLFEDGLSRFSSTTYPHPPPRHSNSRPPHSHHHPHLHPLSHSVDFLPDSHSYSPYPSHSHKFPHAHPFPLSHFPYPDPHPLPSSPNH
ncbi:kelch-like protein 18 [Stegodyphus dumicola]|uniref:kelch-like protein 18 n=1 Tax=Stegodyphus dumicola TaxID=202533 RepID=UPI0015B07A61|nr:kelch-like protein 18 [Stegodyphus dumicola]